ncbi:MAG: hypothetical protein RL033_2971 [Pseudomonadota bacterium]
MLLRRSLLRSRLLRSRLLESNLPLRLILLTALGAGALGCNVAIGGGVVALAGGAGILAAQCYDQVRIRVRDERGVRTCDALVSVSSEGSESELRPCYHASLTEGRYRVRAQRAGYLPAEVELDIPERKGACPHYTRSVEFTLRRPGERPAAPSFHSSKAAEGSAPTAPRPATAVPAPIPVAPAPAASGAAPATSSPDAPATATPAPAGPPTAEFPPMPASTPPPAPAPSPAPSPSPAPAPSPAPSAPR